MTYKTIESCVGKTPLVRLQRMNKTNNKILLKLEGDNPAGSVKDRPAMNMIRCAEERGQIKPGDTLVEATSGNTGIALAMSAAIRGYKMILIMPENMSKERRAMMKAFGSEIVLVSKEESMEGARDLALQLQSQGKGIVLDQFANQDNPNAHYSGTGPEIWEDTNGEVTHFVSSMGTTGTVIGVSRYLKENNKDIQIIAVQPKEGAQIPGIRRWSKEYLPKIYDKKMVDEEIDVSQEDAEHTMRLLAKEEGIFCGVSSGGAVYVALEVAKKTSDAVIVAIVCDRGDRYISTGVYPAE
jgi:cysteine synthase B